MKTPRPADLLDEDPGSEVPEERDLEDATTGGEEDSADTGGEEREPYRWALLRTRRGLVLAAVVLLLAVGGGGLWWWQTTTLPDDAAFRIGDQVVTVDQLDQQVDTMRALYGVQPPQDGAQLDQFRRDAAKSYAVALILDRAAADQGVVVADKAARDVLTRYISRQLGDGPDARAQFVTALGTAGTTEDAVITEIKRQLAIGQLFGKVVQGVAVSDADVVAAFPARKDSLGTPEKRDIQNIVVTDENEARDIAGQLAGGADFATLARQRSLDGSTREAGGALGQVTAKQLEDDYARAAFAAAPGAVFGPVSTSHGWNVGKVGAVTPAVPAQFDQVRDSLKAILETERSVAVWRDWLGARIHDAAVEYAEAYRPGDPDAVPDLLPSSPAVPGQPK